MAEDTDVYTRTIRVPVRGLTASKAGRLNRAMKDYRRARELAAEYFRGEGDPLDFSYSDREALRKRISSHERVDLHSRTIYTAITTVEQNYAEYAKGRFDTPPRAERADTVGLEGQATRIFNVDGTYYLDVATGRGSVALPLRTTDESWHTDRLPLPDAAPARGQSRTGIPFANLGPEDFPANTVKLSMSTLSRTGERSFVASLVFQHEEVVQREVDDPRFVVGVDRGRNQLISAAVYDTVEDHVVDWLSIPGDEIEHRMERFAERIAEFQRAQVWKEMEDARRRRFRYKRDQDFRAANQIVDLARERFDVAIALEDLSSIGRLGGYASESRRFAEWSYGRMRDAIAQKAEPYDIPILAVDAAHTSQVCSRCGAEETTRSGVHFECRDCGYQQHADANAAVNIGKRAAGVGPLASDAEPSEVAA